MNNPLYAAFTGNDEEMMAYFEATTSDQMRLDFKALIGKPDGIVLPNGLQPGPPQLSKLEAFTMAAMTALIRLNCLSTYQVANNIEGCNDDVAIAAVTIARATLSELSKQQSDV